MCGLASFSRNARTVGVVVISLVCMGLQILGGSTVVSRAGGAVDHVDIQRYWLTGSESAWGVGNGALRITRDGGYRWRSVLQLPSASARVSIAVSSSERVAVTIGGFTKFPGAVFLYSSVNGGQSWRSQRVTVPQFIKQGVAYVQDLVWVGSRNLLMLVRPNVGANDPEGALLSVTLGGQSRVLSVTQQSDGRGGHLPSSLGSLSFENVEDGFLFARETTTSNYSMFDSRDSGKIWSGSALPDRVSPLAVPTYFASSGWLEIATPQPSVGKTSSKCIIISGKSLSAEKWHRSGTCEYISDESGYDVSPFFISVSRGWDLNNGSLERTEDGGESWSRLNWKGLAPSLNPRVSGQKVIEIQFANRSDGWVLESQGAGTNILLTTKNGGNTWASIRPVD
jgi:photosystem II stability/assembly factor-like uncharacterized protein